MAKDEGQRKKAEFLSPDDLKTVLSIFVFFSSRILLLSIDINQTQEELEKVAREISDLHETLRVKDNALKLAETRLENRTNRFNCFELESFIEHFSNSLFTLILDPEWS